MEMRYRRVSVIAIGATCVAGAGIGALIVGPKLRPDLVRPYPPNVHQTRPAAVEAARTSVLEAERPVARTQLPAIPVELAGSREPSSAENDEPASDASDRAPSTIPNESNPLAAEQLAGLSAAVTLSESQKVRAAQVLVATNRLRALIARSLVSTTAAVARQAQLDAQEQQALLAIVSREQQPLLAAYFARSERQPRCRRRP